MLIMVHIAISLSHETTCFVHHIKYVNLVIRYPPYCVLCVYLRRVNVFTSLFLECMPP